MTAVPRRRLDELLDGFSRVQLTVWGDLVMDEFLQGEVKRISREAPVLILEHNESHWIPGGAANTAANIVAAGARAAAVGLVGEDESGRQLTRLLSEAGIDVTGVLAVSGRATPTKTRVSGSGLHTTRQQIVRIDRGGPQDPGETVRRRLSAAAEERARASAGLVVADYGYLAVTPEDVRPLLARLETQGLLTAVDSRWRLTQFQGVGTATPNEPEVEEALGVSLRAGDAADVVAAGKALRQQLAARSLLVTRGSKGMAVFTEQHEPAFIPVFGADEVADVTGAGDTVMAVYSIALAAGGTPLEAAHLANIAGGLVVMKEGTATVSRDELRKALETL